MLNYQEKRRCKRIKSARQEKLSKKERSVAIFYRVTHFMPPTRKTSARIHFTLEHGISQLLWPFFKLDQQNHFATHLNYSLFKLKGSFTCGDHSAPSHDGHCLVEEQTIDHFKGYNHRRRVLLFISFLLSADFDCNSSKRQLKVVARHTKSLNIKLFPLDSCPYSIVGLK